MDGLTGDKLIALAEGYVLCSADEGRPCLHDQRIRAAAAFMTAWSGAPCRRIIIAPDVRGDGRPRPPEPSQVSLSTESDVLSGFSDHGI